MILQATPQQIAKQAYQAHHQYQKVKAAAIQANEILKQTAAAHHQAQAAHAAGPSARSKAQFESASASYQQASANMERHKQAVGQAQARWQQMQPLVQSNPQAMHLFQQISAQYNAAAQQQAQAAATAKAQVCMGAY